MPGGGLNSLLPISYVLKQFISRVLSNSSWLRHWHAEFYCIASVAAHTVVTVVNVVPQTSFIRYTLGQISYKSLCVKFSKSCSVFLWGYCNTCWPCCICVWYLTALSGVTSSVFNCDITCHQVLWDISVMFCSGNTAVQLGPLSL